MYMKNKEQIPELKEVNPESPSVQETEQTGDEPKSGPTTPPPPTKPPLTGETPE